MLRSTWRRGFLASVVLAFAIVIIAAGLRVVSIPASFAGQATGVTPAATPTATATATATPTAAATPKCTTWATAPSDYGNNRWFANGVAEIKTAKTAAQATNAAHIWLAEVRKDPNLLVGAVKYFLNVDVAKSTLSSGGCATDRAAQLVTQMELVIGQSKVVAAVAPSNGTNTGVDKGVVVASTIPTIGGDRKAIQFTLPDGRVIWVMARCGNIVTVGKSPLPPGKTDNQQPRKPIKKTCPPGQVKNQNGVCVIPKSSNPLDYQAPGRDNTRDSGTGVKPRVPTVTTQPESSPPPVVTSQVGGGGVIDTATNAPGSETGVTAPGATPVPTTTRSVPAPEPGVNPPSGENTGVPVNPFS